MVRDVATTDDFEDWLGQPRIRSTANTSHEDAQRLSSSMDLPPAPPRPLLAGWANCYNAPQQWQGAPPLSNNITPGVSPAASPSKAVGSLNATPAPSPQVVPTPRLQQPSGASSRRRPALQPRSRPEQSG